MSDPIKQSDAIIAQSFETLLRTERGQQSLRDLKQFLNSNQQGLDTEGAEAVVDLVKEFFLNHRRFFQR